MLRVACCVLRVACCVLRVACCVLRVACCVLRVACCVLRVACCVLRVMCCVSCDCVYMSVCVNMYVHTLACVITVAGPTKVSLLRRHVTWIYEQQPKKAR